MFKNFKGSHPLRFDIGGKPRPVTLNDTQIGDVFVRQGAVCMRVQDRSGATKLGVRDIINLQSGAVWGADENDEIQMVRATLVVE